MQISANTSIKLISLGKKYSNAKNKLNLLIIENKCSNNQYQPMNNLTPFKVDFYHISRYGILQ